MNPIINKNTIESLIVKKGIVKKLNQKRTNSYYVNATHKEP